MTKAPLCFILMPFGIKANADGSKIDFDRVYQDFIAPSVGDAELEPIRADHEVTGGINWTPKFPGAHLAKRGNSNAIHSAGNLGR
jgi:hypothetical protein